MLYYTGEMTNATKLRQNRTETRRTDISSGNSTSKTFRRLLNSLTSQISCIITYQLLLRTRKTYKVNAYITA